MKRATPEQTHALLEKPDQKTDKADLRQKADKADLLQLAEKTDSLQKNVERLDGKVDMIIEGMDAQAQQFDIIRTDMKAIGGTLDLHERRHRPNSFVFYFMTFDF